MGTKRSSRSAPNGAVGTGGQEGAPAFEALAEGVLRELREALMALVGASGRPVRRAVDLQRALEVDAPLAWRVFKVVTAEDALSAAAYVPTPGQVRTLLAAGERAGVPARALERVRRAMGAYDELRVEHAGDRAALDAMIAALRPAGPEGAGEIDERTRRAAFEQNARIWGLRAAAAARAFILVPGPDPARMGAAAVAGLVDLHAVRPGVPLVVHARAMFDTGKGVVGEGAEGAYRAEDHSGLMEPFCTPGLEYRTEVGEDRMLTTRVCAPGIGRRAAATAFSLTRSEVGTDDLNSVILNHGTSTPVEACHLDLLVPAGLTDPRTARGAVYGRRTRVDAVFQRRPADLLPIRAGVSHAGTLRGVPAAPGVPRWPEVVRHVLDAVGAGDAEFDVYRCSVAYPVLHTLVSVQVDVEKRTA